MEQGAREGLDVTERRMRRQKVYDGC